MGIVWIVAIAVAALIAGNPATWYEDPEIGAVQSVYRDGVPHTDRQGRPLNDFDPDRSFFPIGIYHGVAGEFRGRRYDLGVAREAGFNAVHMWEGQSMEVALAAAAEHGLQLVYHYPKDDDVRRWRDHPGLLAWYLDEDPSIRAWDPEWNRRFDAFQTRKAKLHEIDPGRPVLALDGPFIDPPRRDRWLAWNAAGDISAHWNYPIRAGDAKALTGRRGIPESMTTAVRLNGEKKPVWLVVQAFGSEHLGWRMPSSPELRAMVFAGLVHGATGIFYFSLDSFVTRDGQVAGVAPWAEETYGPSPDYDGDGRYPLVVSPGDADASRALWQTIATLNGEIAQLAPALLSPTARLDYSVRVNREGAPVRTLLKQRGDELTLIIVNVEPAPVELEVGFDANTLPPVLRDRLEGFDARIYRLQLRRP